MVRRPGSARPIDSNVVRPMTSACPIVVALKWASSSGRCHGIPPSSADDAVAGDGGDERDAGQRRPPQTAIGALIDGCDSYPTSSKSLEVEVVDAAAGRDAHRRQRVGLAGQLQPGLLDVVGVQVGVAQGVHEVAGLAGR